MRKIDRFAHYILKDKKPVMVDLMTWARFFEGKFVDGKWISDRIVKHTYVYDTLVSTVFLGLDHNWDDDGPPILFETMVFGGPAEKGGGMQDRYATWEQAEEGP